MKVEKNFKKKGKLQIIHKIDKRKRKRSFEKRANYTSIKKKCTKHIKKYFKNSKNYDIQMKKYFIKYQHKLQIQQKNKTVYRKKLPQKKNE
ncbi:MAG: hypothetical protein Q4F21_02945 [Lachnospiraceae bacterium]|nr:hypothetical protein [Lachnospiraceae bacterium]